MGRSLVQLHNERIIGHLGVHGSVRCGKSVSNGYTLVDQLAEPLLGHPASAGSLVNAAP